jgi:hypothetical protein
MRRAVLAAFVLIAACERRPDVISNGAAAPAPGEPDNRIDCAPAGAAAFARVCSVEVEASAGGRILTLREAGGGFRRLRVTADGVAAADGAEPARATRLADGRLEVAIGGDRFRLPAPAR